MPRAASWSGTPSIRGSSESMRMALLTFSLVGLSFTWGIEMTYCTPYLLQLGLTKSRTSAVWIAGPLSGLIMQPLVGVIADDSKSKWGRRRPFMIGGSFIVAGCLLCLGWTSEIVDMFITYQESKAFWTIALAIASIYAVDFSINVVQSCCRSLIVDTLPIPKQQLGSAWASRMGAIGHLIGYAIGTLDLRSIWGDLLGDTQFKQLCLIAGLALIFACSVTSYAVKERILISSKESEKSSGAFQMVAKIFKTTMHLPNRIQAICWVQFWAWIGWFPFLFYSPTWVGETYFRYSHPAPSSATDKLGEIGRIGSLSLVIFSTITFASSVIFPFLIRSPDRGQVRNFTPRPPKVVAPILKLLEPLQRHKPDLLTAWMFSHLVFASAMLLSPFVRSLRFATVLVSVSGIPWALACWAPFAFMGVEINRLTTSTSARGMRSPSLPASAAFGNPAPYPRPSIDSESPPGSPTLLRLNHGHGLLSRDSEDEEDGLLGAGGVASTGETAGIYLGILNLFTTLPQFVGTFISMFVFAIFEPDRVEPGEGAQVGRSGEGGAAAEGEKAVGEGPQGGVNAIAICLFIGGLCSIGAAYATRRLKFVR